MQLLSLLKSGFSFDESSLALEFKFKILNAIMMIAALFAFLFALLSDFGINEIGPVQSKVDYVYSTLSVMLFLLLRRSRSYFMPIAVAFTLLSYATFTSALLFVVADEFRIIWFYFVIFVTYIMFGSAVGMAMTLLSISTILVSNGLTDLQLSDKALYSAVFGLFAGSMLSRIYTVQMRRYEQMLQAKNSALAESVEELDGALDEAQKASRTKSLFLANMSHEIRTPMNGVLGMVQVMRGTTLDDEQAHYLETIERSGKTLLMLLDDLLDLSKIEAGKLHIHPLPFDTFNWVIDIQVISEPLFEESKVAFISEVCDDMPKVLDGDAARLQQVVVNLISNAAKFTREGEVRLSVGGEALAGGKYCLRVVVEDSGVGIPEEKLATIFDAFQQASPERIANKGVGLGLTISKRLADAMGGALNVDSVVGQGSRFTLEVELAQAEEVTAGSAAVTSRPLNVLLVDDDPINRLAAGSLLRQQGHRVAEAANGSEALDRMAEQGFDVVLMDVHMPVMDGVEATRRIRAMGDEAIANTAIVGLTASVMSDEQQTYIDAGMDAVAAKPVVLDSLMHTISRCVARRSR